VNSYDLVVVDLDKTIILGDSVVAFSKVLMDYELLDRDFWSKKSILDSDGHYFSLIKKQVIHELFHNLDSSNKCNVNKSFLLREELSPISVVIGKVDQYRLAGYKVLVTTASLDFIVKPVLNHITFSYDYLHCSSFDLNGSDSKIQTKVNNTGVTKLQCLKDHFNSYGKPRNVVVFSDHFSDLPILMFGDKSFVVKDENNFVDDWTRFFNFNFIQHPGF
jgi:phosphoserine phosphatase